MEARKESRQPEPTRSAKLAKTQQAPSPDEAFEELVALRRKLFGGKPLPGESADLIREAREIRDAHMDART